MRPKFHNCSLTGCGQSHDLKMIITKLGAGFIDETARSQGSLSCRAPGYRYPWLPLCGLATVSVSCQVLSPNSYVSKIYRSQVLGSWDECVMWLTASGLFSKTSHPARDADRRGEWGNSSYVESKRLKWKFHQSSAWLLACGKQRWI